MPNPSGWKSRWLINTATTANTADHLHSLSATHRLPEMIVSDNGSVFTSIEFQDFCTKNGTKHVRSALYHSASNGLAERAVQSFKETMKRADPQEPLSTCVSRFLFKYHLTHHSTIGVSPAELLLECRPRSHFDFMLPNLENKLQNKQYSQKVQHDKKSKPQTFTIGSNVLVRNFCIGSEWLLGMIVNARGPVSYIVKLSDGRHIKHQVNHLRHTDIAVTDQATDSEGVDEYMLYPPTIVTNSTQPGSTEQPELPC